MKISQNHGSSEEADYTHNRNQQKHSNPESTANLLQRRNVAHNAGQYPSVLPRATDALSQTSGMENQTSRRKAANPQEYLERTWRSGMRDALRISRRSDNRKCVHHLAR